MSSEGKVVVEVEVHIVTDVKVLHIVTDIK